MEGTSWTVHSDAACADGRQKVLFFANRVNWIPAIAWLAHTGSATERVRRRQFLRRSLHRDDRQMPAASMEVDAHAELIARLPSDQRPWRGAG